MKIITINVIYYSKPKSDLRIHFILCKPKYWEKTQSVFVQILFIFPHRELIN